MLTSAWQTQKLRLTSATSKTKVKEVVTHKQGGEGEKGKMVYSVVCDGCRTDTDPVLLATICVCAG